MLAQLCSLITAKATHVLVLGSAGSRLVHALRSSGFEHERLECVDTIERAVDRALDVAAAGETVLLAPVFDLGEHALTTFSEYARNSIEQCRGESARTHTG